MTRQFHDESGRRWKAWLASRDVYWPDPDEPAPEAGFESVIFVCFSDPGQPQRRAQLPSGSFAALSIEDLKDRLLAASADPVLG